VARFRLVVEANGAKLDCAPARRSFRTFRRIDRNPLVCARSPINAWTRRAVRTSPDSGRGQTFAARWADLVFVIYANIEVAKRSYKNFKDLLASIGRNPAEITIAPAIYVVAGETQTIAEDRRAMIDNLAKPIDTLALLSEVLNFDMASKGIDEAFTAEELASISGLQAIRDRVVVRLWCGRSRPEAIRNTRRSVM
jgi:alkanesulfonate monooxygenase SsuD/methylene tetrahydromethanopterin reductase-like flavin-dependent oxidoreductase (luciferase family)